MKDNEYYENKRDTILEAYYKLVATDGIENTSMAKIANSISIPSSLLFYYFKNKQELIYNLIEYMFRKCEDASLYNVNINNENAKEEFEKYIDYILSARGAIDIDSRVYFTCLNIALRDEKAKELFTKNVDKQREKQIINIDYFISKGVIDAKPVEDIVDYITIIISGLQDKLDFDHDLKRFNAIVKIQKEQLFKFLNFIK